jgi:hypothetical protein
LAPPPQPQGPEEQVFVVWSHGLYATDRILADMERYFEILDVTQLSWSEASFSKNLTRFYGGLLPAGAEKEKHCGTGPFLVIVVRDPSPSYAPRRTPVGVVNAKMFDAKRRYRAWTGGGHRVHCTLNQREADRDLFLLLGRRRDNYRGQTQRWDRVVRSRRSDPVGASGWRDTSELLAAIEVTTPYVQLYEFSDLGESGEAANEPEDQITVLLAERDRAFVTITGSAPGGESPPVRHSTTVAGRPMTVEFWQVGEGCFDHAWERALLRQRLRNSQDAFVPGGPDRFYTVLYHALTRDRSAFSRYKTLLDSLALADSRVPPGDYGDPEHGRLVLDRYLREKRYRYAVSRNDLARTLWLRF